MKLQYVMMRLLQEVGLFMYWLHKNVLKSQILKTFYGFCHIYLMALNRQDCFGRGVQVSPMSSIKLCPQLHCRAPRLPSKSGTHPICPELGTLQSCNTPSYRYQCVQRVGEWLSSVIWSQFVCDDSTSLNYFKNQQISENLKNLSKHALLLGTSEYLK